MADADAGEKAGGGMFYGWVIVWAAFTILFVSFGAAYSFPAFFTPLQNEFGATRGDTSFVFGIAGFLYFFLGAFSGPAGDRLGPKQVVVFGAIVAALGLEHSTHAFVLHWILLHNHHVNFPLATAFVRTQSHDKPHGVVAFFL